MVHKIINHIGLLNIIFFIFYLYSHFFQINLKEMATIALHFIEYNENFVK